VGDDDGRTCPGKCRVGETVEMHDLRPHARRDFEQPVAGSPHVVPGRLFPFELERPFGESDTSPERVFTLARLHGRPHHRECRLDPAIPKRRRKIERVLPHASDCIRRHQDPLYPRPR